MGSRTGIPRKITPPDVREWNGSLVSAVASRKITPPDLREWSRCEHSPRTRKWPWSGALGATRTVQRACSPVPCTRVFFLCKCVVVATERRMHPRTESLRSNFPRSHCSNPDPILICTSLPTLGAKPNINLNASSPVIGHHTKC